MSRSLTFGYRRVSSIDQSLARQDLGECDRVYEEKLSGKSKDRPELKALLAALRDGDEVRVWSIDRLGRNMSDLLSIVSEITAKGASIHFISEKLTFQPNESDPLQNLQFHMMSAFAEFERSLIEKRRLEGIARAQAEGRYRTGKPLKPINMEELRKLYGEGVSMRQLAQHFGVAVGTIHARLKSAEVSA